MESEATSFAMVLKSAMSLKWMLLLVYISYVSNLESARERTKNTKENDFLMFGFTLKNITENQI